MVSDLEQLDKRQNRIEDAIERLTEISADLNKMLAVNEQRILTQEQATKDIQSLLEMRRIENNQEIKELHSRITAVNQELSDKINHTEKKILDEIQALRTELKGDTKGVGNRLTQIEMWK